MSRRWFEAGARTAWHRHTGAQILFVEKGRARAQERGGPLRELATGQETIILELNFDTNVGGMSFSPESNQGSYEIVADNSSFIYKFNRDGTNLFRFPWENANYVNDDFPGSGAATN